MFKRFIFNLLLKCGKKIFSFEFQKILHRHAVKLSEEYYTSETPLTDFFNQENYFKNDNYKLLDAGCSGGISFYWHRIKDLSVVGIDLAKEEIDRLNREKKSNSEQYVYAQIVNKKKVETKFINNFDRNNEIGFNDTGAKKIQDLFDKLSIKNKRIVSAETRVENLIKNIEKKTLKEICEENNFEKVNFVDIDLDSHSLLGLYSLENLIKTPELFGIKIEVVFPEKTHGDYFLKICEFMHEFNYSLVKVLPKKYGTYELPNQFMYDIAAQSIDGFDHQGDLIYIKTINHDTIKGLDKVNFCKFLTTLELINLQGFAIKLLDLEKNKFFNDETKKKFKDLLTIVPSKANFGKVMSHDEYTNKIEKDPYSLMKYVKTN
tara:strand:+ start:6574 stop:7701 length:1128 start_codon:yes stop_codon:yes gene_type:complete